MGIPYDCDDAISKAQEFGTFFNKTVCDESQRLGKDRGNFPWFEQSTWYKAGYRNMRNSDLTTIAPTGQTSMYAGCSSGIEPIMFPVSKREQAGMVQVDYHPLFVEKMSECGLNTPEVMDKIGILGSVRKATFLPDKLRNIFPCAHDIHYDWHIKHQAAWQQHITASISKTINLPHDATVADVADVYLKAYRMKCKGITVYRDGSRMNQPISSLKTAIPKNNRSEVTHGTNRKIPCGCGNIMLYCGNNEDGKVQEVTARLGKSGGCSASMLEALARISSIAIQYGVEPEKIVKQLSGIRCHLTALHKSKYTGDRPRIITSCPDAMSVAIEEHMLNGSGKKLGISDKLSHHSGACPNCGGQLMFQEGCSKCSCGYSRC